MSGNALKKLSGSPADWLGHAVQRHQSGDLPGAKSLYEQVLASIPGQADALHLLGVVHHQCGDHEEAIRLIRKSVKRNRKNADAWSNLGAALTALDEVDEAKRAFQKALTLNPQAIDACSNLAVLAVRAGDSARAIKYFTQAHKLRPEEPRFLKRLAEIQAELENHQYAFRCYEKFLALSPDDASGWNDAGFSAERVSQFAEAERCYRLATEKDPSVPEYLNNLGGVLSRLGRGDEAKHYLEAALARPLEDWADPANCAGALFNAGHVSRSLALYKTLTLDRSDDALLLAQFGAALLKAGQRDEAEATLRKALSLNSGLDAVRIDLAYCLLHARKLEGAMGLLEQIKPDSPFYLDALLDLALVYSGAKRFAEACKAAKAALGHPQFESFRSNKPYSVFRAAGAFEEIETTPPVLSDIPDHELSRWAGTFLDLLVWADTPEKIEDLAELHRRWGRLLVDNVAAEAKPPRSGPARGKIRLGFLSSDLRSHSVARFVLPLLQNYDRDDFEIFCYSPGEEKADILQNQIKSLCCEFRIVGGKSYREIADVIHDDRIDILFELNGFTADSHMMALAYKPAPVQIYWLGYPFTTGIPAMDYVLQDPYVAPTNPETMVEAPLLMPGCWVCYDPFEHTVVAGSQPMDRNGCATFGSLNNPYKFTAAMIASWAKVMTKVPGSRYLFSHPSYDNEILVRNITRQFAANGVTAERLHFMNNRQSGVSHFAVYDDIDLSLDTFPLTGGTTTCDALWMGVPTVTRVGPAMHQRLSNSHLSNIGLPELCADDEEEFVQIAAALANDRDRLKDLRSTMRDRMMASPLQDAERFGQDFCDVMRTVVARHNLR